MNEHRDLPTEDRILREAPRQHPNYRGVFQPHEQLPAWGWTERAELLAAVLIGLAFLAGIAAAAWMLS